MTSDDGQNIRDEGRHLHDIALAAGLDAGRYVLVADPADPDATKIYRGPYFHQAPTGDRLLVWAQQQIDSML